MEGGRDGGRVRAVYSGKNINLAVKCATTIRIGQ